MGEIVRLPTAAKRKVERNCGRKVRDYREQHPWPGEWRWPAERDAERAIAGLTAAEIGLMAVVTALDPAARAIIAKKLLTLAQLTKSPEAIRAAVIASS